MTSEHWMVGDRISFPSSFPFFSLFFSLLFRHMQFGQRTYLKVVRPARHDLESVADQRPCSPSERNSLSMDNQRQASPYFYLKFRLDFADVALSLEQ